MKYQIIWPMNSAATPRSTQWSQSSIRIRIAANGTISKGLTFSPDVKIFASSSCHDLRSVRHAASRPVSAATCDDDDHHPHSSSSSSIIIVILIAIDIVIITIIIIVVVLAVIIVVLVVIIVIIIIVIAIIVVIIISIT